MFTISKCKFTSVTFIFTSQHISDSTARIKSST